MRVTFNGRVAVGAKIIRQIGFGEVEMGDLSDVSSVRKHRKSIQSANGNASHFSPAGDGWEIGTREGGP